MFNIFNKKAETNQKNNADMICPKCGNRFHVFTDYNRHCGGDLYWCECTECKTITKIHHSKEAAIVAFKEGLVHKNEQSEHIWA